MRVKKCTRPCRSPRLRRSERRSYERETKVRFGPGRSARDGHKYVQARYQPPVWAYSKWPDLPRHYTKNFDAEYTAMAEAWLAEQERLIKLGSWEPPRIEKTKELSSTITFREYALDFVQNRRKPNGRRIAPTTREKYLQYLDDYLLPVLGGLATMY